MAETYEETPPEEPVEAAEPDQAAPDVSATEKDNLAAFMTPDRLKTIGIQVVARYERDLSSRSDRMKKLELLQKLYALVAEPKSFPWHNCANIKTPALTGPNLQIQARLFDMILPPSGKIFTVVPATVQDEQFAHVTEQFANSYVRYKMPYMAQGLDDTLHQMTLYGSSFRRTYWDEYEGRVRSDWIPIEDFVVAYSERSQDPSMSNVGRYTLLNRMSTYDLDARGDSGYFVNVTEAKKVKCDDDGNRSSFQDRADQIDGVTKDGEEDDEGGTRKVLEQHCKWKLPNEPKKHPAFDGREHYVMITVDRASGQVLRMNLREEDDPDDRRRYDRQFAAYEQYGRDLAAYQQQQMTPLPMPGAATMTAPPAMGGPPDMSMGGMEPVMGAQAPAAPMGDPMAMQGPPAPLLEPKPVEPPKPVRRRQICFFTHYRCFPSDGFYGLGYGDLLYGIAVAQNTVINQWVDGQAVKNARPMFMSRQIRMQRGAINIGPAAVNEIDAPVASIKDAIHFLDPPNSDPGTVPLIKMLDGFTDRIAGNGDLMSGQAPGSNQTKGGMQILNEQMMAPITVLARRVKEAFRHELDKIWRCWGVFLEDDEVVDIVGEGNRPEQINIGRAMFTPSAHLVPASDPRMKSQRLEDLQSLTQFVMSMPVIAQNPPVGGPVMLKLCEMVLRVMPDGEQLIPMLRPPPPPPPQPKDQIEENAGFLQGQNSPVLPPDNDDEHLAKLQDFMQSPEHAALEPKGQQAVMQHVRDHLAQRMKKGMMNGGPGQASAFGPMGGGPPGMAGPPGFGPPAGPPQQGAPVGP
jgi:hypothetical protein